MQTYKEVMDSAVEQEEFWARNENTKLLITSTVILGKSYNFFESQFPYLFIVGLWLFLRAVPTIRFWFHNNEVFF